MKIPYNIITITLKIQNNKNNKYDINKNETKNNTNKINIKIIIK